MFNKLWHRKELSPAQVVRQQFRRLLRDPERRIAVTKAINKGEDIIVADENGNSVQVKIISNHANISM